MKYRELFEQNTKYIDHLLQTSLVANQYLKNIGLSGNQVELGIRDILKQILPSRYHVTHGYIVSCEDSTHEPQLSPQIDLIIVDTLVPHRLFLIDNDVEIVPLEAVIGIFEIKRTLNKQSLQAALKQLADIITISGVRKDCQDRFLPGGIRIEIDGGYHSNPMIGILSLKKKISKQAIITETKSFEDLIGYRPDIIYSFNGDLLYMLYGRRVPPDTDLIIANPYPETGINWHFDEVTLSPGDKPTKRSANALGFILGYLANTCAKKAETSKYYFNQHI